MHSPSHLCPLKEKILPDVASRRTSSSILLYSPDSISISTRESAELKISPLLASSEKKIDAVLVKVLSSRCSEISRVPSTRNDLIRLAWDTVSEKVSIVSVWEFCSGIYLVSASYMV